jgi:uncharacterized protein
MPFDIHGHYWTIAPWLSHVLRPEREPAWAPFSASIEDPALGALTLHGKLQERPGETSLLVIVHGLGGTNESHYVIHAAAAATRAGVPHLRLNLRGAGGAGLDFYHAGLFADLHAAVSSPALARYERIVRARWVCHPAEASGMSADGLGVRSVQNDLPTL